MLIRLYYRSYRTLKFHIFENSTEPNTAGKTISDVLVDAVQESLVFFKTLTTIDSWKEQSDQFFKMGKLENMMETLIALPDARINAADKKRLERALKDFSEGRAQAEMNYEELYS